MTIKIDTEPTTEPITLEEAKDHLRVDITDDDTYIESLIKVARRSCEHISNHKFITQTWDVWLDGFPGSATLELPKSLTPLQSVTHIKYWDKDQNEATYSSNNYEVDTNSEPGKIVLKRASSWPSDVLRVVNGVEIQVNVGYGDDADVPWEIRQAILLLIGHLYENRETVIVGEIAREIPMGVRSLLWFDRNVPV
jgi:uncharacterized phiE125 gp8 family phage protein